MKCKCIIRIITFLYLFQCHSISTNTSFCSLETYNQFLYLFYFCLHRTPVIEPDGYIQNRSTFLDTTRWSICPSSRITPVSKSTYPYSFIVPSELGRSIDCLCRNKSTFPLHRLKILHNLFQSPQVLSRK